MTANVKLPAWAGSLETMSRRVKPIIHLIEVGKSVLPSEISNIVRPEGSTKDYSAKYITFLRLLGFEFSVVKQGRQIVSYMCVSEPANAEVIRSVGPKAKAVKAPKAPKAPKEPKAPKAPKEKAVKEPKAPKEPKAKAPVVKKAAAAKKAPSKKGGNAENLAKLKEIGKKFKKESVEAVLEEDVAPTTFSIDGDFDSIEGIDLSKLI